MTNIAYHIEIHLEHQDEEQPRWMYWGFDGDEKDKAQSFYNTLVEGFTNQEQEPIIILFYELELDSDETVVRQNLISSHQMGDEDNPAKAAPGKGFEYDLKAKR